MKQIKFKFPANVDMAFCTFSFSKQWKILLSYAIDDFFNGKIIAIVAMTDEQVAEMQQSEWKQYVVI